MTEPRVDVIIPVHDPARQIDRAIASVLESGLAIPNLRINVVCHGVPASQIRSVVASERREMPRYLEFADGEPSPAGPFMYGLRESTAEYVSIMGSDDQLEAGALHAWLAIANSSNAIAVIPPERHASGAFIPTPPTRPGRRSLDPIKDRVSYRTAPLGLVRLDEIRRLGLDMPSRLRNGSDQLFGLKLWFSGGTIVFARGAPCYVVGGDAPSRVTTTPRPASQDLQAVREIAGDPWYLSLPARVRRAIAVKSVRVHIFSVVDRRTESREWSEEDAEAIASLMGELRAAAPHFERSLSIADRRVISAIGSADLPELGRVSASRRRYAAPRALVTSDWRGLLARDGALRFVLASALARRGRPHGS